MLSIWQKWPTEERFLVWVRTAHHHAKSHNQPLNLKAQYTLQNKTSEQCVQLVTKTPLVFDPILYPSLTMRREMQQIQMHVTCHSSTPCQTETITTQLNDSPMLNTLKWKQPFTASFQSHSSAVGLSLSSTARLSRCSLPAFWSILQLTWTSLINRIFRYSQAQT